MSVKGKMSRSSLGQVMPVHADPLGFTNASFRAVNQVTFSYRTNTDAAAALLPTELEIDENPRISAMFLSYGFSSVGPFREYIHIIHARFRGEDVGFVPHIFISNERGMLAGREREGYPKLLGGIEFDMNQPNVYGLITARLSRPTGFVLAGKPGRDQSVHVRLIHVEFNAPEQLRIAFSFSSSEHPPFVRDEDVRNEADVLATEARVNYVNVLPKWTDAAESV